MTSATIRKTAKRLLKRAVKLSGSNSSELVYKVDKSVSGGDGTPLNTGSVIAQDILLVDAIFREYTRENKDVNILAGDKELIANNDVEILSGDEIKQGSKLYTVINVELKAPTSDVLIYIAQLRRK